MTNNHTYVLARLIFHESKVPTDRAVLPNINKLQAQLICDIYQYFVYPTQQYVCHIYMLYEH